MNRTAIITIGAVLAVAVGGVVIWLLAASSQPIKENTTATSSNQSNQSTSDDVPLSQAANGQNDSKATSVTIQDMSFQPAKITVKKGTTVTWTNKDDVGHNVVSDNDAPAGGPPKTANLIGKNEVFSFTYDTVGTFPYHCTPHPFMQGTVEVTE